MMPLKSRVYRRLQRHRVIPVIRRSGLFDEKFYAAQYPEVASSWKDLVAHYVLYGFAEGRDPNPYFNTEYYLRLYPDVAASGTNPLLHYILYGSDEGRDPGPQFSTAAYVASHPELRRRENPLRHFLKTAGATPDGKVATSPPPRRETQQIPRSGAPQGRAAGVPVSLVSSSAKSAIKWLLRLIKAGQHRLASRNARYRIFSRRVAIALANAVAGETVMIFTPVVLQPTVKPLQPSPVFSATALPALDEHKDTKVQVFRYHARGDVLLATPVLREMKARFPRTRITFSTLLPDLVEGNPNIDELVVLNENKPLEGFDHTYVLDYEHTPDLHIVDSYARCLGIPVIDRTPELYLSSDEIGRGKDLLVQHGIDLGKPVLAMHLTCGSPVRHWPPERFAEVAKVMEDQGVQIVVVGHEPDVSITYGIDLRGKTTLREVAAVISHCTTFLCIDSGLMHLAFAMRVPTVSLFGPTDPEKRVPDWAISHAIYGSVVCKGCYHRQRPVPVYTPPVCPHERLLCMESIAPELVTTHLDQILAGAHSPKVTIIIPVHNRWDMTEPCLASIFRHGALVPFEVIVVDDASSDDTPSRLSQWEGSRLRLIRNEKNQGFAKTCNRGAVAARGQYLVFLNNDTTVTPGWIDKLVSFVETDSAIGMAGPKLLYPDNTIQHCGSVVVEGGIVDHLYRFLPASFAAANRKRYFRALTGACVIIQKDFFHQLGMFDELFRSGGEDTDLSFKVLETGKKVAYCPSSVVYHYEGMSRGIRDLEDPSDRFNRQVLRERWQKYLTPDIEDYLLLGEIESFEHQTWSDLAAVPQEIVGKYLGNPVFRTVGRWPFRIEIGSGMFPQEGYIHLEIMPDAPSNDVVHDATNPLPFRSNMVSEILANHVIEHFSWRAVPVFIRELYRVLVPDGVVYLRTPNLRFICESYINGKITPEHPNDERCIRENYGKITPGMWANLKLFSGQDYPSNFHYVCWDEENLTEAFKKAGFRSAKYEKFGNEFSPGELQIIAIK